MSTETHFPHRPHALAQFEQALSRDPILYAELYCENARCPVREAVVHFKDFAGQIQLLVAVDVGLHCPVCFTEMKVHWVATSAEHVEREDTVARASVNCQMFLRDAGEAGQATALTAQQLFDSRLPPTPVNWFKHSEPIRV